VPVCESLNKIRRLFWMGKWNIPLKRMCKSFLFGNKKNKAGAKRPSFA
jgi:hypothetical protein